MKPDFWDDARRTLSRGDPVMRAIIRRCGSAHLVSRGDPFQTLARSIVGQQISVRAAQTVWERLTLASRDVTPERIGRMRVATLRGCGLSERKVEYLKDLAARFRGGEVDPVRWRTMDDESVIGELVEVRGIGRWTAEMFLIFNLLRPDVFPVDDIGLLRAIALNYAGEAAPRDEDADRGSRHAKLAAAAIGDRWRPWRSVATWYLWRSLDPLPVEY
jgi:DNA-3-methyladenine glycosylase II